MSHFILFSSDRLGASILVYLSANVDACVTEFTGYWSAFARRLTACGFGADRVRPLGQPAADQHPAALQRDRHRREQLIGEAAAQADIVRQMIINAPSVNRAAQVA